MTKGAKVGEEDEVFATKKDWAGQVQHWFRVGPLWLMTPVQCGPRQLQNKDKDGRPGNTSAMWAMALCIVVYFFLIPT